MSLTAPSTLVVAGGASELDFRQGQLGPSSGLGRPRHARNWVGTTTFADGLPTSLVAVPSITRAGGSQDGPGLRHAGDGTTVCATAGAVAVVETIGRLLAAPAGECQAQAGMSLHDRRRRREQYELGLSHGESPRDGAARPVDRAWDRPKPYPRWRRGEGSLARPSLPCRIPGGRTLIQLENPANLRISQLSQSGVSRQLRTDRQESRGVTSMVAERMRDILASCKLPIKSMRCRGPESGRRKAAGETGQRCWLSPARSGGLEQPRDQLGLMALAAHPDAEP